MMKNIKRIIKTMFRVFGIDIKKINPAKYSWLKQYNIATVIDIGANTGQFAKFIHKELPSANIISFEPISECYNKLKKKMKSASNFQAFNYALGDIDDSVEMKINNFTPSSSLLSIANLHIQTFPFTTEKSIRRVKVKRLDDIAESLDCKDNLLIKIDVQGYEDRVIKGGQNIISSAKMLIIETSFQLLYKGQPMFEDIYDNIISMGFKYAGAFEQLRSPCNGSVLQADAIFIKKE